MVDLPGYGSKTDPNEKHEYCECGRTRRPVWSQKLCQWCECGDQAFDEMRDRELMRMADGEL